MRFPLIFTPHHCTNYNAIRFLECYGSVNQSHVALAMMEEGEMQDVASGAVGMAPNAAFLTICR